MDTQEKPHVVCHMVVSLNGKTTGEWLNSDAGTRAADEYYRIHREYRADAFLCGRATMEGSFTRGNAPELAPFADAKIPREDFVAPGSGEAKFFAVALDPRGKLGWQSAEIRDPDPGYDGARVVEALAESVSDAYLAFLRSRGISYIFCGKDEISVPAMLKKLRALFSIKTLLLEGGGVTNGKFAEADSIDELSVVVAPVFDGNAGETDLFADCGNAPLAEFSPISAETLPRGSVHLRYAKPKR